MEIKTTKKITGEYSLQKELIQLLISKGYPEESLNFDWQQGENTFNLAIFDPVANKLLAIFEYQVFKPNPIVITSERIRKLIKKYATLIADSKVHFYVIDATENENSFSISKILPQTKNSGFPVFLPIKNLLDFQILKSVVFDLDNKEDKPQDVQTLKLIKKIDEIEGLKTKSSWGPEYKIWDNLTKKLVKEIFGTEGLELFEQQQTVVLTDSAYKEDLEARKILLQGLLINKDEYALKVKEESLEKLHQQPLKMHANKKINWTKWGTVLGGVAIIVSIVIWMIPNKSTPKVNNSSDSINTTSQTGGINTINNNTMILNQITSELVNVTQVGKDIKIDLNQLKYKAVDILYVARNGQVLISPDDWKRQGEIITFFNDSKDGQFIVQYSY